MIISFLRLPYLYLQNEADTLRVAGKTATVQAVQLQKGWNWIGYPLQKAQVINDAFNLTNVSTADVLKSVRSADGIMEMATYSGNWSGLLTTMNPKVGYKVFMDNTSGGTLTYNSPIPLRNPTEEGPITAAARTTADPQNPATWTMAPLNYEYVIPVIGEVIHNGITSTNTNDRVAAFVGNDLRGVTNIGLVNAVNKQVVSFLVGATAPDELFTLYYFDAAENEVYEVAEPLQAKIPDNGKGAAAYGTYSVPYPIEINLFSVEPVKQDVHCAVDKTGFIEVTVTGAFTPTYAWSHDGDLSTNRAEGLSAGIYLVTITDVRNIPVVETIEIINQETPIAKPLITGAEDPICKYSNISLNASSATTGATFKWYDASNELMGNAANITLNNRQNTETYRVFSLQNEVCQSDFTMVTVNVSTPGDANFTANITQAAINEQPVTFTPITQDASFEYAWDFGDGNNSLEMIPKHTYSVIDQYNVLLTLTSPDLCTSSSVRLNYIATQNEIACTMIAQDADLKGNMSSNTYRAAKTIHSTAIINSGSTVEFMAGESITLTPGFHAKSNAGFLAKIAFCMPLESILAEEKETTARTNLQNMRPLVGDQELSIRPNPSAGLTKISFSLIAPSTIKLEIYDPKGGLVKRLIKDEFYEAGPYELDFLPNNLNVGVYHVVLKQDQFITTKKLIIIH